MQIPGRDIPSPSSWLGGGAREGCQESKLLASLPGGPWPLSEKTRSEDLACSSQMGNPVQTFQPHLTLLSSLSLALPQLLYQMPLLGGEFPTRQLKA